MKNIVILISGTGSNMAAIVRCAERDRWSAKYAARVACVISNKSNARGLLFAKEHGIAAEVLDHAAFDTRDLLPGLIGGVAHDRGQQSTEALDQFPAGLAAAAAAR